MNFKKALILIGLFFLVLINSSYKSLKSTNDLTSIAKADDNGSLLAGYKLVHTFAAGGKHHPAFETKVYVKWLVSGIFTNLLVVRENNGKVAILYIIERDKFYMINHKPDTLGRIVQAKNFYGYKLGTFRDDYPSMNGF